MGQRLVITLDPSSELAARQAFGSSAAATGVSVCSCIEDFTFGPLPNIPGLENLLRLRYRHWRRQMPGAGPRIPTSILTLMAHAEAIEIWSGGTAREQLCLMGLVYAAASQGKVHEQIAFRQFHAPNPWDALATMGREAFLNAPAPFGCSAITFDKIVRMWRAVSAPEPTDLLALSRESTPIEGLPYLNRGLHSLLDCYPDQVSGLDSTGRLLLAEVGEKWTNAAQIIAPVMTGQRGGQVSGDLVLFLRLREMADPHLVEPALLFRGNPEHFYAGEFHVTKAGVDFLAGKRNAVKVNGINRWIGGVHLDSRGGNLWFRCADGSIRRR